MALRLIADLHCTELVTHFAEYFQPTLIQHATVTGIFTFHVNFKKVLKSDELC